MRIILKMCIMKQDAALKAEMVMAAVVLKIQNHAAAKINHNKRDNFIN